MGFRLRRSARLGPLRFNFSSGGLSSISVGGRGAYLNIPVNRSGGPRTTVGLPGTGLSWSVEHTPERPAATAADSMNSAIASRARYTVTPHLGRPTSRSKECSDTAHHAQRQGDPSFAP